MSHLRTALLTGASLVTMLVAQPAFSQTVSGIRGTAATGSGGSRPNTGAPVTTLPPTAQAALARQNALKARTATAMDLANQAQAAARSAALAKPSTTPNGLKTGGLMPAGAITVDPSLWQNANKPTETTSADGKTTVEIDQTASKAILTWDSFNVGKDTTVYFNQSAGTQKDGSNEWIALNRINDPSLAPSKIEGVIKAEGSVYLINRNGILFSGTSQVNTHSLIVSGLNFLGENSNDPASIAASNTEFLAAGIKDPNFSGYLFDAGPDRAGDIRIDAGAEIETSSGGFSIFAGNQVSNAGSIISNEGQTLLFAGTRAQIDRVASTAGKIVLNPLDSIPSDSEFQSFAIDNSGIILALRGDASLFGGALTQSGLLMATTSITRPGSINVAINGFLSKDGPAIFTPGSLTAILPDGNAETTTSSPAADDVFKAGSASIHAVALWFQGDSTLYMPGASVDLSGGGNTASGVNPVVDGIQLGRIQVDDGAILSVAGLADVERPMSDNLVTLPRVGQNELADSPLQRDGILYKSPFTVDGRDSGTREDGLQWVGSPVANVGSYVQNTPRTVNDLLVDGGSISMSAGGVVLAPGSSVDVSGGYTQYLGGSTQTSRLIGADGRVYDASTADPLMTYVGFAGQTTVDHSRWNVTDNYSNSLMNGGYESSYVQGGKGGSLSIVNVAQMILAGALYGDVVIGRYQIGDGKEPQGASLNLKAAGLRLSADGTDFAGGDFGAGDSLFTDDRLAMATNDIDNILWTPNISAKAISAGGFGSVSLAADMITVDSDAALAVNPGGSITLTGNRMDVFGDLTAHSGHINLVSNGITGGGDPQVVGPINASEALYPTLPDGTHGVPVRGDITIGSDAVLDVSGLWVNDFAAGLDQRIGNSFIDGGSISVTTNTMGQAAWLLDIPVGIGDYDTTGSVILKKGSLLNASSGGYVDQLGHVAMKNGIPLGKGGDVTLRTYGDYANWLPGLMDGVSTPGSDPITGARLEMDGTLKANGFSAGGTLTLQASGFQIGGDPSGLPDFVTYLPETWFADQGFGGYNLTAIYDATIADGATVRVSQRNYVADPLKLARLATGSDIESIATPATLDPFHRQATDFSLNAGNYLTWNAGPFAFLYQHPDFAGVTGTVSIGEGASIQADAGADVALSSYGQITVDGSIVAHGGSVELTGHYSTGAGYDFMSRSIWLGKDSLIDVSGVALIDPFAAPVRTRDGTKIPVTGTVLDGGSVSIQGTNAYVVADKGSTIDVSGADAVLDIRTQSSNPFAPVAWMPTEVASAGGNITLGSSNGLYFDGTLVAHGGNAAARGGTLQIASLPEPRGSNTFDNTSAPLAQAILLQQSGDLVTDAMMAGGPIEDGGAPSSVMHFAVDRLGGSGIDTLILGADPTLNAALTNNNPPPVLNTIAFAGDVNLSLDRAVVMNARNYLALADGTTGVPFQGSGFASVGAGKVSIGAAYVALAGGSLGDLSPVLAGGDATLDVNAHLIDLIGQFALQRFADANFTSDGDIRLMMPAELGYVNASTVQRSGELVTAGDLTFKAGQVYPATGNVFLIAAPTEGSTVTFLGNGSVAPPISAGGALLVDAANIVQDGTIRAPSGTIQLGVGDVNDADTRTAFNNLPLIHTSSVTLGDGSLTSVSLDNRSLPYGSTTDGKDWLLIVQNSLGTTTKTDVLSGPPEKLIGLAGDNVDFRNGATVDLSGGGNLYAQEWVPGTGGSRDLLNAVNTSYSSGALAAQVPLYADGRPVYAVVPGYQAPVAAYDPTFGYSGSDLTSSLGKAVYLSGVPGLPDGIYTLLPGQYATMPGAFRVVQQTGTIDSAAADDVTLADRSRVVSGRFVDALTGKQDARTTSFLVQSQDVWKQYSEYTITDADDYFPGLAAHAGTSATRTPFDAGRLVLAAVNELILDGDLNAKAGESDDGKGGRAAAVDISAQAIQILGGAGTAQDGYLQVDAMSLSNLGAESLLIGGTRSDGVDGTTINATATSVLLSNDSGSALTGPEVMLVTTAGGAGIVLESGSVLAAKGDITNASTAPILIGASGGASGDGALVRVSNGGAVSVIRTNVPGLDGVEGISTALLDIRDGASIQGGKSTILDATGSLLFDPGASFSGDAVDVNANAIAFLGDGSNADPSGFVVGDALLAQLVNVGSLGLHSRSTMTFYGNVDLATKQSLVLGAEAFASDGGTVTITAPKLTLTNDVGGTAAAFGRGDGTLTLNAGELDFAAGAVTLQGFGTVTAMASQGIVGQGTGSFDFGDLDVAMTAPVFTADSGANTTIKTTGALALNRGEGTAIDRETLGGALSLSGGSLTTDATITASAGNVSLTATTGDLTLLGGALVSTKGYNKTFFDTEAYAPAGNVTLTASTGAVAVDAGATLDVSGADKGGDAGGLTINAAGALALNGALNGKAADDYRGGRLTLASGTAIDLDSVADLTQDSGFSGGLSVRSGVGNLTLSAGKTLKGQIIYLAANGGDRPGASDGNVIVNGTIEVSGEAAGHIDLFGKSGVDVEGKLLAVSSVPEQDGGVVTIGTTGVTDGTFDETYGYETVQLEDSGVIHIASGALIDVSGGSADAGGQVSFRAPLVEGGDVRIAIDGGNANIKGAARVTIEPYAKWSTADAQGDKSKYFDGIIDPAGWYGADGKLVAGTWTDEKGNVLDAPADDEQLKEYLTKDYFTPDTANPDHVGFFGYVDGDPAKGPGTLMGFTQAPGFSFGDRYVGIAGLHIRPGIELANPGDTINGGDIDVLTNWNLGAGEIGTTGGVTLDYRYGGIEAPVLTVRAEHDINLRASITDGFFQQNDGAHLQDPVLAPGDTTGAYNDALAAYQNSKNYLDSSGFWTGTIMLVSGSTVDITSDPNYEPLQAPLTGQSFAYYANYTAYIGEVGDGSGGWASSLVFPFIFGYLNYSPDNAPNGNIAPNPSNFVNYADYVSSYQSWLTGNFSNKDDASRGTTPTPILQPIETDYSAYSSEYQGMYIPGHSDYYNYIINNVGNIFSGVQLFYAPFAPRADQAGNPAYNAALTAYQASKAYMDANNVWTGTIQLHDGGGLGQVPGGGTVDLSSDPYYKPILAPATGQSNAYYGNYMLYIGEVGDGTDTTKFAFHYFDVSQYGGFLTYSPTVKVAPQPGKFGSYDDYLSAYNDWLQTNFGTFSDRETTPSPLLLPIATDYTAYSADYAKYAAGYDTYLNYMANNDGVPSYGTQLFYAPFAPGENAASDDGSGPKVVPVAPSHANNDPSNMPIAGSPASLASATLFGGESSSYRFVAGADFNSVDPLGLNSLTGTGSVTLDDHFEVIDSTKTDDDGNKLDPKGVTAGRTVLLPNVIRTGVGSIDIAAASDIALLDPLVPGAIYTGGEPAAGMTSTAVRVVRPGLLGPQFNFSSTFLLTAMVQPDNGGDITLTAGGDILGNQEMVDVDGTITGRPGSYLAQYWYPWLNTATQTSQDTTSIDFGNFDQGVLSAGGDVSVSAGGDIREFSVSLPVTQYRADGASADTIVGGGDLSVDAGGDILGGSYLVDKGTGRIEAGGRIGQAFTYTSVVNPAKSSPISTFIAMQDAQVQVIARGDIDLGRVLNPDRAGPFSSFSLSPFNPGTGVISEQSSLQITSTTGNIDFGTLNAPEDFFGAYSGSAGGQDPSLPATVSMNALDGGIAIEGPGAMVNAPTGQLSLLADGDIRLVNNQTINVQSFSMGGILPEADPAAALKSIPGLLHADDPEPARVYSLTGDIIGGRVETQDPTLLGLQTNALALWIPKAAEIRAGRDIVNLVFLGQNLHDSDVTSIIAGRDIIDMPGGRTTSGGSGTYALYVQPGLIQLGGPGRLDIQAGRDLGPLDRDLPDAGRLPSTGIQTIGNYYNPYLPRQSADISVLFGTGPGVAWDSFAAAYLDPAATGTDLPSFNGDLIAAVAKYQADMDKRAGGAGTLPDLTADQAWAAFQTMPEAQREALVQQTFFKILQITGADEENPDNSNFGKYARGYQAIETLFPSASGYPKNNLEGGENGTTVKVSTGDLDIRGSTIQTQMGGDINIMGPGGQLLIGSTASPPYVPASPGNAGIGPQSQGILAWETGAVNIFSDRSVLLAQSRIFTERGGDMTIWSSNGDINAGKGSKTSSEIKPVGFVCSVDFYCRIDAASAVTGAGIAAFPAAAGDPAPTVTLAAPRGTVDFGDAGVRVAGNLIVAAQAVANADNVQVSGTMIGVPTNQANVSVNLAASSTAANAAQEAATAMQKARQNDQPSYVIITIDSFGTEPQY